MDKRTHWFVFFLKQCIISIRNSLPQDMVAACSEKFKQDRHTGQNSHRLEIEAAAQLQAFNGVFLLLFDCHYFCRPTSEASDPWLVNPRSSVANSSLPSLGNQCLLKSLPVENLFADINPIKQLLLKFKSNPIRCLYCVWKWGVPPSEGTNSYDDPKHCPSHSILL